MENPNLKRLGLGMSFDRLVRLRLLGTDEFVSPSGMADPGHCQHTVLESPLGSPFFGGYVN